jgi:hypothetical protein
LKIWQKGRQKNDKKRRQLEKGKDDLKKFWKDTRSVFRFQKLAKIKKVGEQARCHFCGARGVIMEKFPRRGYG